MYNVKSMNQDKLKMVKQNMARVKSDILGTSELKQMRMANLIQMNIISTTWARFPQKKWSSHHGQQKSPKCGTWGQPQK